MNPVWVKAVALQRREPHLKLISCLKQANPDKRAYTDCEIWLKGKKWQIHSRVLFIKHHTIERHGGMEVSPVPFNGMVLHHLDLGNRWNRWSD